MAEITEEFIDSEELVEQPREVPVLTEQPTIYDQAYWDQDRERLSALHQEFKGQHFTPLERTLWKELFSEHLLSKQMALKIGELSTQLAGLLEAPAPIEISKPRKRARVPKQVMPEFDGPDAA